MNASIIIAGHNDFYDKGNDTDSNYKAISFVSPTTIEGADINLKTVGNSAGDNLVLQGVGISAKNQVKIEAKKGEFKHEVRQFEKSYDNQQAEQISLMV